jgi:2-phosphosulfolactate phosphatase
MQVKYGYLLEGAQNARGIAVIIDVFRAFTCTPLMFSLGLKKSILVSQPREALALKQRHPDYILIGEVGGLPIEGFDLGNSPSQILSQPTDYFRDKIAVQRTSAGVQGALAALEAADKVLVASYSIARATARYILTKRPALVSLVAMGWDLKTRAPEDDWCARYIAYRLGTGKYDHDQAMREIVFNQTAQRFLSADQPKFPPEDPVLCLQRDVYDFALEVRRENKAVHIQKLKVS